MGLFDRAKDMLGMGDEAPLAPVKDSTGAKVSAPRVTPIRRNRGAADVAEIQTLNPKTFEDSADIAAWFRDGVPVVVNIVDLSEADARKMFFFLLGLKAGLEGHIKRITGKVYLLTPNGVAINDEDDFDGSADDLVQP
jgi:cell division inhibitor SepF